MRYKVVKRANAISVPATDVYCAIPAHANKVSPSPFRNLFRFGDGEPDEIGAAYGELGARISSL